MTIRTLCVSVDYADMLSKSIEFWKTSDRLIVVTSPADTATQDLCREHGVQSHVADDFYANDAKFNKALAMNSAIAATELRDGADWLLTIDADVIPPEDWREQVDRCEPRKGKLYGATRYRDSISPGNKIRSALPSGFFCLFHNDDPHATNPLFSSRWPTAGDYDVEFARRWPLADHVILPLDLIHLGTPRVNWEGRKLA